tara:strand:+ start:78 stop:221 length:144 start_codon:yes stop_codon:yes gene_type:complete
LDGEPLKRKREWGKPRSDIPVEANLNPAYGPNIYWGFSLIRLFLKIS